MRDEDKNFRGSLILMTSRAYALLEGLEDVNCRLQITSPGLLVAA